MLSIEARFRPGQGLSPTNEIWLPGCVQHFINLRGYLMGQMETV